MTSGPDSEGRGVATGKDAERAVGLTGSPNFRDAGGYVTADGAALRRGLIYRSGHLATLSDQDVGILEALGLDLVIDLRRDEERAWEPSRLPASARLFDADITPGSQAHALYNDSTRLGGAQAMFDFMCEINREFVLSQSDAYGAAFAELLASDARRVLFHCSAGKDRTGFAIAMLQLALGVAIEDIEADYLLSARYYLPAQQMARVRRKYQVDHLSDEDLLPMLSADLAYLHSALEAIDSAWPSREAYLAEGLGLGEKECAELRRRFVC
jgi:protein-tyrosine phosphatase